MNQAGLENSKEYCKLGGHSFEHGYRGMKELLELEDRPTGVILGNYNTMLGGIMALNESGLSCPQDVSLIGVDNLPMTQVLRPKLWLIVQPMETMCEKAVAMLLERVNGEQNGMPVKISFSTSVRGGGLNTRPWIVHKQNAQKSVGFVVKMDKKYSENKQKRNRFALKTVGNLDKTWKQSYNLFMYQRCAGEIENNTLKNKKS